MPPQVNLEELCGDVMKMNLHNNEDGEDQSKSVAGSWFGQNSALVNWNLFFMSLKFEFMNLVM